MIIIINIEFLIVFVIIVNFLFAFVEANRSIDVSSAELQLLSNAVGCQNVVSCNHNNLKVATLQSLNRALCFFFQRRLGNEKARKIEISFGFFPLPVIAEIDFLL